MSQDSILSICDSSSGTATRNTHLNNVSLNGNGSVYSLVTLNPSQSSKSNNLEAFGATTIQLYLRGDSYEAHNTDLIGGSIYALFTTSSAWNHKYTNLNVHNASGDGVYIGGSYYTLHNVKVSNANIGIINRGFGIIYSKVLITNTASTGFENNIVDFNGSMAAISLSIINSAGSAFLNTDSSSVSVPVIYNSIFSNSDKGLSIEDEIVFEDTIVTDNNTGIEIYGAGDDHRFSGNLVLGNTTDCMLTSSGSNLGLRNAANCENDGSSNASFTYGESLVNYFVGGVSDTVNLHGSSTAVGSITDWTSFENFNRLWTISDAQLLLDPAHQGSCLVDGNCMIFDWSLTASASQALDINGTFNDGDICPAKVYGDNVADTFSPQSFLKYASEILRDGIGNDDGLCNSDEACIFNKNIGFDQGSGTLKSCVFQDGVGSSAVTGVEMFSY